MTIPKGGLCDDWVLEQIRNGCVTTQDLLDVWNTYLDKPVSWANIQPFKSKCNKILNRLEKYGYVMKLGKVMQAHAMHTCWAVKV